MASCDHGRLGNSIPTMTTDKPNEESRSQQTAGLLFSIAGLIWVIGSHSPIGLMNFCIGVMFFAKSRGRSG